MAKVSFNPSPRSNRLGSVLSDAAVPLEGRLSLSGEGLRIMRMRASRSISSSVIATGCRGGGGVQEGVEKESDISRETKYERMTMGEEKNEKKNSKMLKLKLSQEV